MLVLVERILSLKCQIQVLHENHKERVRLKSTSDFLDVSDFPFS